MKKTLTLLALLGTIAATTLFAGEEVWWTGVTHDPDTHKMEGAITSYKHYYAGDSDSNMCWVAAASNVIAWWQDRVEENGALIIPEGAPRDYEVFETERHLWPNVGGYEGTAIQMWLTGASKLQLSPYAGYDATETGLAFTGYYPRLAGACMNSANYRNTHGANPDTLQEYPIYKQYEYTTIQTYWFLHSNHDPNDPEKTQYEWASEKIVEFMQNDWGVCWATAIHAMTVYGVELDDDGNVIKFYNSDNNWSSVGKGYYSELSVGLSQDEKNPGYMDTAWGGSSSEVNNITAIRTTGIRFLDYDVRIGDNLVTEDEAVFSHYCNLIIDGRENFDLKYDLRDASVDGSPVDAKKVEQYTEDEGLSWSERYYDEEVPTGDMRLRGGKVTLVNCAEGREKLDGGGSVEGSIIFEDSRVKGTETIQEANRTLKVDRTDTIAKEIKLDATLGTNTLEVTDDHIASFGKLTGKGNLTKTGSGTAEVTEALDLDGHVTVQNGYFLLGESATFSGNTTLTVASDGHVSAKGSEASITLTLNSGVHLNDGEMTLTTTVNTGATLKGSGSFGMVTVSGGDLIVGNSPGHQDYEGALTLNSGRMIFSVAGLDEAAALTSTGWESGTYSNIDMHDNAFTVGEDGRIVIALSQEAADSLTMGGGEFALALVSGMSNELTEEQLAALANQTTFQLSAEEGAGNLGRAALNTPQFTYQMSNGVLMLTSGVTDSGNVPEPATSTLSLLALAGLMARRRRK